MISDNLSQIEKDNDDIEEYSFLTDNSFSDNERDYCRANLKYSTVKLETKIHKYEINTHFFPGNENQSGKTKYILFLHGHGSSPSWRTWIKLAIFFNKNGCTCYLIDMPGFGISTLDGQLGVHFKRWKDDGPEFLKTFLQAIQVEKVHIIGRCGGAALTIRTISAYPDLFESSHVFHNNMISEIPKEFCAILQKRNYKIFSTWTEDSDHIKLSVGYKWWNLQRKKENSQIKFMDIDERNLSTVYFQNKYKPKGALKRLESFQVMDFSEAYLSYVYDLIIENIFNKQL